MKKKKTVMEELPPLSMVFSKYTLNGLETWDEVAQLGSANIKKLLDLKDAERFKNLGPVLRQKVLDYLNHLAESSSEKPYLLSLVPYDYFEEGDDVLVYLGHIKPTSRSIKEDWVPAKVVQGYRHQDGIVNYEIEISVHDNLEYHEKRGGFCGMSRPEVLKKGDFEALREAAKSDPEFFEVWCKGISTYLKDFDLSSFKLSLATGSVASFVE